MARARRAQIATLLQADEKSYRGSVEAALRLLSGIDEGLDERVTELEGASSGVTDHGALSGLGDDDHPQYLLADGTRNLTGNLTVDGGVTIDGVDISAHAASNTAHGISAFGATLVDDANAAAARTTLGLHAVAASGDHGGLGGLADDDHPQYLLRTDVPATSTRFVARVAPIVTVASTTSPTSILGGAIVIPANTLTINGQSLRVTLFGTNRNNTGNARGWDYAMTLNGATLIADAGATFTSNAGRRPWWIDAVITRLDATHALAEFRLSYQVITAAPTTGIGDLVGGSTNVQAHIVTVDAGIVVDWTAAQNFDITVDPTENSAALDWITQGGAVEAFG